MTRKTKCFIALAVVALATFLYFRFATINPNPGLVVGQVIDDFNGVKVYYNGAVGNAVGRNTAPNGYNIGQKYQCVEFVKRYYLEHLHHEMPDPWGHAKDFFDSGLADGAHNARRNLRQFSNPSLFRPEPDDLLVMGGNLYGHVAIISQVTDSDIEIVQQNPGPFSPSRERIGLTRAGNEWRLENHRIMGWLRKEN